MSNYKTLGGAKDLFYLPTPMVVYSVNTIMANIYLRF